MRRTLLAVVAAMVVVVVGPPEGGHYLRAQDLRAQDLRAQDLRAPEVRAQAPLQDVVLRPTGHPRVPQKLSEFWMAPPRGSVRTPAQANLATAAKLLDKGEHTKALALLTSPAYKLDGLLATYAEYYKGLALLRIGRLTEARSTFQRVQTGPLVGYLFEMAALREAECDETLGDQAAAVAVYERLAATKTLSPDDVLLKLGRAAKAAGAADKAQAAFERLYYDYPLSDFADDAAAELGDDVPVSAGTLRFRRELARAERLFMAKQYAAARPSFERLRAASQGEDRTLVTFRVAESDYYLRHYRSASDTLRPFVASGTRPAEALYYYALAQHDLKDNALYHSLMRRVVTEFPDTSWAEDALNSLALVDAHDDEDEAADQESAELFEKFPKGRYTERAAWRIGWRAYRRGQFAETVRVFERAAFNFPRSDYRPAWLYWSGRAHDALSEPALAESRYAIEVIDYLNTYYGQLALARLGGRIPDRASVLPARALTPSTDPSTPREAQGRPEQGGETTSSGLPGAEPKGDDLPTVTLPANADLVRQLLTAKMYDEAADELRYAQTIWGDLGTVEATFAWTYRQQGQSENGSRQFSLYRGSMNAMKRAYPQYLTAGGERLPREILRIIYPIAYWDLIQKYSAQNGLDPFTVVALICQESTFVANIRSPAKAVGLMQLEPATARQYARRLGIPYAPSVLTTPELNIRIGTAYLADQMREFGEWYRVLAAYNAGDGRMRRWAPERPGLSKEEFIDDIPFYETQGYVRRILATAEDYRRLYGSNTGVSDEDAIPGVTETTPASDVDPSLNTKKKPAAKPAPPAPATRKKRPAA